MIDMDEFPMIHGLLDAMPADRDRIKAELDAARLALQVAKSALESAQGNINPECGYCDEVEKEIREALAIVEGAMHQTTEEHRV